jgi:hypothetical protein
MDQEKERAPVAMGQLRADEAGVGTTIVGGQPLGRGRSLPPGGLPVGVEKLLYIAATDQGFREALLNDREGAIDARGLSLRPSERSLLRSVPEAQLLSIIDGIDVSPENLARRGFLKTVAVATATVIAAEGLVACGDDATPAGIQPDMPPSPKDGGPDSGPVTDHGAAVTGIRPGW